MDDILLKDLDAVARGTWWDAWHFATFLPSRQISMASFAIQAKLLGADPAITRLANILLHAMNSLLVARVALLVARRAGNVSNANRFAIAAALLWAVLPVHATTVLYPVQRMTVLSAMGSLAVFILVLGRLSTTRLIVAFAAFGAAILAKENAVLAMPAAFLLRGMLSREAKHRAFAYWTLMVSSAAYIAFVLAFNTGLELTLRYSAWDFSLMDRMLVAPRIFAEYALSILAPLPDAFAFYSDDYLSNTLRPLSSIYLAVLLLTPLVFLLLNLLSRNYSIAAAGVAIYIFLHSVEGTALALDLYVDHRNYLPSVGLALALTSIWMRNGHAETWKQSSIALIFFLYLLAVLAYRSNVMRDEVTMAQHHLATHPTSFRSVLDTQLFGVDVSPRIIANYPYPIELEAISYRATCAGARPPFPTLEIRKGTRKIPNRSLRLHADMLNHCENPCVVDREYLLQIESRFLDSSRRDSYEKRISSAVAAFRAKRLHAGCL